MKLIHDMIVVDLKNDKNEKLIINTLLSLFDVIDNDEYQILLRWENENEIKPTCELETNFYNSLCDRQYIMSQEKEEKIVNNIMSGLRQLDEEIIGNPRSATFLLSYDCNFDCPYCYEKNVEQIQSTYTKEMVDRVFELHKNGLEQIGLFGGEPLLLKNREIIEYIYNKHPNASYFAITNGYYLEEYCDFFKKAKTKYIQVTIDGTKAAHNQTRILKNKKPTYDKILDGIRKCLENSIPIKIRMNYNKENLEDCIKAREELLNEFKDFSKYLSFESQALFDTSPEEKWSLFQEQYKKDINDDKQDRYTLNQLHKTLHNISRFFENGENIRPLYNFCTSEQQNRFYDINGDIYNCILAVGRKNRSIGTFFPEVNYKNNSMLRRNIESIPQCFRCRFRLICGGGCPNPVVKEDGNALLPNCSTLREQIEFVVPYLYNLKYGQK